MFIKSCNHAMLGHLLSTIPNHTHPLAYGETSPFVPLRTKTLMGKGVMDSFS